MKKISDIFLLFVFLFTTTQIFLWHQQRIARISIVEAELRKETSHYRLLKEIIKRESSGRYDVYGDNGASYGLCQFKERTFRYYADKVYNMPWLDWKDPLHQITLMDLIVRDGRGPSEWTTYKAAEQAVLLAEYRRTKP